jgi:hypothetical protein
MSRDDYISDNVKVNWLADGNPNQLEELIGKKVKEIINGEYSLKIIFEDGSYIETSGVRYGDCPLGVECKIESDEKW